MKKVTDIILQEADAKFAHLSANDFGLPAYRKFPMTDANGVRMASVHFGNCKEGNKRTLAKNIVKKAKEFGVSIKNKEILKYAGVTEEDTKTAPVKAIDKKVAPAVKPAVPDVKSSKKAVAKEIPASAKTPTKEYMKKLSTDLKTPAKEPIKTKAEETADVKKKKSPDEEKMDTMKETVAKANFTKLKPVRTSSQSIFFTEGKYLTMDFAKDDHHSILNTLSKAGVKIGETTEKPTKSKADAEKYSTQLTIDGYRCWLTTEIDKNGKCDIYLH